MEYTGYNRKCQVDGDTANNKKKDTAITVHKMKKLQRVAANLCLRIASDTRCFQVAGASV